MNDWMNKFFSMKRLFIHVISQSINREAFT